MSIEYIIAQLINGLRLGSVYAIVAIGYSIVYGILRLINFAHGDIMTSGVYVMLLFMTGSGMPLWSIILISVLVSVIVGVLIERLAYRPLRSATEEATLISSLAVSTLLQNLLQMIFSPQKQAFKLPDFFTELHDFGMFSLSTMNLITFKVIVFAFAVGSGMAALAGLMLAGEYKTIDPLMGFIPGLKAFCAAVVGGIGSLHGAVVGGLTIGVAEMLFAGLMPTSVTAYRDAFVFIVLILVLLFCPNGFFGRSEGGRS